MNSAEVLRDGPSSAGPGADRRGTSRRSDSGMWTTEDVAAFLKVSVSWVRHRVAANKLPHHRVGGWIVRFEPAEIRAWATSRGKR